MRRVLLSVSLACAATAVQKEETAPEPIVVAPLDPRRNQQLGCVAQLNGYYFNLFALQKELIE